MTTKASAACRTALGGLLSITLMFGAVAMAQEPVKLRPADAPPINGPKDAALDAAANGDYVAARDFARKAAAAGQPLDAERVAYIEDQAARQEKAAADLAKLKAAQAAATPVAAKIKQRQKEEYTLTRCDWETAGRADKLNAAVDSGQRDSTGSGGISTNFRSNPRETREKSCPG